VLANVIEHQLLRRLRVAPAECLHQGAVQADAAEKLVLWNLLDVAQELNLVVQDSGQLCQVRVAAALSDLAVQQAVQVIAGALVPPLCAGPAAGRDVPEGRPAGTERRSSGFGETDPVFIS
jgi:hypothetical protein